MIRSNLSAATGLSLEDIKLVPCAFKQNTGAVSVTFSSAVVDHIYACVNASDVTSGATVLYTDTETVVNYTGGTESVSIVVFKATGTSVVIPTKANHGYIFELTDGRS